MLGDGRLSISAKEALVILVLLALSGLGLYLKGHSNGVKSSEASWSLKWNARDLADTMATLTQEMGARAEEARRQKETQEIVNDARNDAIKFEAKYNDAVNSGERLQRELRAIRSKFKTSEAGGISTVTSGGYTAAEAASLLAELYGSLDRRAGEIARFADEANRAGARCEQIYNANAGIKQ